VSESTDATESAVAPHEQGDPFADVLAANASFQQGYADAHLTGTAARGLGLLTCIDSRIDPLRMLGLQPGDAKILRNAGARVTEDVLRTLALASYLLGVERFMIVAHTDCRMAAGNEASVHAAIAAAGGPDTRSMSFLTTDDQHRAVRDDVQRVRSWPFLGRVVVGGFLYHLQTGRLERLS
jgi:carbonic anhydrase